MIIQLPVILPGELDLVDINKKLRQHQIILDWSSVISAPESQLAILLDGIDLEKDADWLGIDGEISDHIANDIANYTNNQENKPKKSRTKKQKATKLTPQLWEENKLLETQFVPSEGKQTEGQDSLLDVEFVPANNVVIAEAKPALGEENIKPILEATIPSAYKIREELEIAIIKDLRGPAGGEDEELDEDSVSDRYLVGLLAPQHRRITEEKLEKSTPADEIANDDDHNLREVDCYLPGNNDELAISGKGTVEDGSTEVNVPPVETMFPSSLGMTFCVNDTAKALQITAGWGQYHKTNSEILTKVDGKPKKVWKREQIRSNSPTIPLIEGVINNWIVDPQYPEVHVKGQIKKQNNGDFIVSLFLINGQRETAKSRDKTWLFQPELSVKSADSQHPDIR
jgi:hypothetical protein